MKLTEKQKAIFDYIIDYRDEWGYSPTYGEMADRFTCSARNVYGHVQALIKKGKLSNPRGRARMLVPVA